MIFNPLNHHKICGDFRKDTWQVQCFVKVFSSANLLRAAGYFLHLRTIDLKAGSSHDTSPNIFRPFFKGY
jgi:hypothetical protein